MQTQKSPGSSLFPYYYKNGELFGLHLGSFFSDEDGVIALMKAEETFFAKQHHQPEGLWIDFYETKLTDRVIKEFIEMLKHMSPKITKLGIVGASFIPRWKISRLIKKSDVLLTLSVKYFEDPEDAKTWLVSELE